MITEERFSYNFQHFMTSYQRLENGVVAASKQFVRLGLLEMQELDGNGMVTAENAWRPSAPGGIGGLLVRKSGEQKYTYMTNHLGYVYGVFDKTGNRVESHSYSAYGYASGDDFSLQPFGMSSKRSDFASGLVYFGYCFYVPHLGRWLNRDPLQEQGGINLYAYLQGDPLRYVDPDGRMSQAVIRGGFLGARLGFSLGGFPGAIVGGLVGGVALSLAHDYLFSQIRGYAAEKASDAPHTQLGTKDGRNGDYTLARKFDGKGKPVRDIDFTDHGRPQNHPNPHQHRYVPNETGGTPKRLKTPEPL